VGVIVAGAATDGGGGCGGAALAVAGAAQRGLIEYACTGNCEVRSRRRISRRAGLVGRRRKFGGFLFIIADHQQNAPWRRQRRGPSVSARLPPPAKIMSSAMIRSYVEICSSFSPDRRAYDALAGRDAADQWVLIMSNVA
jgi:hypothetical protein